MDIWADLPRNTKLAELSAFVTGSGPDLVLIHGVGLRAEAWAGMIPKLAANFRVWAVDMPGHGHSRVMELNSIDAYADAFERAIMQIGRPVHVAGHSMGAMITLALAGRAKVPISRIAALNAVYRRSSDASRAVRARANALAIEPNPNPQPTLERWFGTEPSGDLRQASDACRRWLMSCDPQGYSRAYHVFAHHDGPSDASLVAMRNPTLFLTGADEPNSTPAMSLAMAKLAQDSNAIVIPNAAHMAPMTHGVEIADELIAFLSGNKSDS